MLKPKLVRILTTGCTPLRRIDAERIVDAIFEEIAAALHRGDRVELRGFGVFSVTRRKARTGRNPRTGHEVPVASKAFPEFKAGREVQQRLNMPLLG
jgi:integration host factor subunit beta